MSGREVWILVVVVVFLFNFSTANNWAFGSRSVLVSSTLPQYLVHGCEVSWSRAGDGSYAGAPWPNPWRPVAPVAVAPTSLSPSFFFNNFMVQFEVSPLHELDLGDLWLDFSIYCYQKVVTSKMQQVRIGAILPGVTLVGSCGLSIPYLLMRWSTWSTSNILDVSKVLQETILHTRNMAFLVSCFSAQSAATKIEVRRHGDDDFTLQIIVLLEAIRCCQDCSLIDQISAVTTSLLMISYKWYAKLNFLHVSILEIMDVSFQHVDFAARWWECLNWNNLPSVNLWCQVNFTVTDLLDYYVHTQYMNFISSKNLGFGILWLRIDIKADPITLELMASTTTIHEQHFLCCLSCTCLSLSKDRHVEDTVSMLFGLFHRRWTTTPPLLIPRFNGRDTVSLSSVKVDIYSSSLHLVCIFQIDRWESHPRGINWTAPLSRPLGIADAAISSLCCRRMNERRMVPFVISSIFFVSLDRLLHVLCT